MPAMKRGGIFAVLMAAALMFAAAAMADTEIGRPELLAPDEGMTTTVGEQVAFVWAGDSAAARYHFQLDNSDPRPVSGTSTTTTHGSTGSHTWKVRGISAGGAAGPWSTLRHYTVREALPDAPALHTPENDELVPLGQAVNYSWTRREHAHRYELQLDQLAPLRVGENGMSMATPPGMAGSHAWKVRGINGAGLPGAWSPPGFFTVRAVAPTRPEPLAPANGATVALRAQTRFAWTSESYAVRYQLKLDDGEPFTVDGTAWATHFPQEGEHTWRVRSVAGDGTRSEWSATSSIAVRDVRPGRPELLAPVAAAPVTAGQQVVFVWTEETYALHYQWKMDTAGPVIVTGCSKTLTFTERQAGAHTWQVRGVSPAENYSEWSLPRDFTVRSASLWSTGLIRPPNGRTFTVGQSMNFAWSSRWHPARYEFQMDNAEPTAQDSATLTLTATDEMTGEHNWRVRGIALDGTYGDWSPWRRFTVRPVKPPSPER